MAVTTFKGKTPCNTCPYRKDVILRHWDISEYVDLIKNENDLIGKVYGCHKKTGDACIGWLMMQDKNYFPSIALRLELSKQKIDRKYLDSLSCESEMYDSVEEMAIANYPEIKEVLL